MMGRDEALQLAQQVRAHRGDLKRKLQVGEIELADVLRAESCQRMTVAAAMRWQIRWGRVRIRKALNLLEISENRMCGDLTERQIRALAEYVKVPSGGKAYARREQIAKAAECR